ncbi:MAG: adenine phosphoribosyltransferase [candidate division Zixibacteria bacterium]|nr:adenine phosphoribosyltransferase [candidate division Zixibacteria bacterium]
MNLKDAIREIPDFPKKGILFFDLTTIFSNTEAYKYSLDDFEKQLRNKGVNKIAAVDARGFIFGGALADRMSLPLTVIRKKGKLPHKTISASYDLEYGTDTLEMHEDSIEKGDKVAVIDDLLATGGTLEASCKMVDELGGEVTVVGVVAELSFLNGRDKLAKYEVYSQVKYDSEEC